MPVNVGDALKSQKKGLKLDVTRMGYLRRTVAKIERVSVWRDICAKTHRDCAWRELSAKRARWVSELGGPSGGPKVHCLVYQPGLTQRLTNFSALICSLLTVVPDQDWFEYDRDEVVEPEPPFCEVK